MVADIINTETSLQQKINAVWLLMQQIADPEVPVLSIVDLGIVRDVHSHENAEFIPEIVITPTYSGCPAMDTIAMNIRFTMITNGYKDFKITTQLSPAWTTDWMTDAGKQKLKDYGIAPPGKSTDSKRIIHCPQCNSADTKLLSEFGSTSCKALYQCNACKEPFDYFKCH